MLAWYFKSLHSYYSAFNKLYFKLYNFYLVNLDKKKIRVKCRLKLRLVSTRQTMVYVQIGQSSYRLHTRHTYAMRVYWNKHV